ncbi:hypothetical protein [Kordia sp.]|uniref:hypothetical protein n=1 Tax=Kordia sp. TaxID=1965332 RepID=UPI003D2B8ED8
MNFNIISYIIYIPIIFFITVKIGTFSIYLGVMLFLNLFLFLRGRKKARQSAKQLPSQ